MFRSMVIHATTMALAIFNRVHTHIMGVAMIVSVTETIAVTEVEVNFQDVSVTVVVVTCALISVHAEVVVHWII